jgi:hypothetical protein
MTIQILHDTLGVCHNVTVSQDSVTGQCHRTESPNIRWGKEAWASGDFFPGEGKLFAKKQQKRYFFPDAHGRRGSA